MSSLFGIGANGASDASFYDESIDNSVRFDSGSSARLEKTPSASNRKVWTWGAWVKRTKIGDERAIWSVGGSAHFALFFHNSTHQLRVWSNSGQGSIYTNRIFRDTSAWYHICLTSKNSGNYYELYVNGVKETSFAYDDRSNYPGGNDTEVNSNAVHYIGAWNNGGLQYFDGYLADVNFIDGTCVSDTNGILDELGELKNGVWIPKAYTGSYGTNGYRLEFKQTGTGTASTSTIGADTSGNTNHYTSSGLASTDVVLDSPTNNFPVLNPLVVSNNTNANTFAEGGLEGTTGNNAGGNITGSMAIPSSGKWYFEFRPMAVGNGVFIGLWNPVATQQFSYSTTPVILYVSYNGGLRLNGASPSYGATYSTTDTIGVAVDVDNGTVTFYKNNASQGSTNFAAGGLFPVITDWYTSTNIRVRVNFGQDSTFSDARLGGGATSDTGHDYSAYISATTFRVNSGWNNSGGAPASGMPAVGDTIQFRNTSNQIAGGTSGGTDFTVTAITQQGSSGGAANNAIVTLNRSVLSHSPAVDGGSSILSVSAGSVFTNNATDDNGVGNFVYAPPSEHLALCSANLPELTIGPNSLTQADDYFKTVLYTGNGSPATHTIGFRPNWVWGKKRGTNAQNHWWINDVVNINKWLSSDGNGSEGSEANGTTFNATSFTTANNDLFVNNNSPYVVWAWKGNGTGTAVSNSNGSIASTVSANTAAGFSVIAYTGNNGSSATVGHGLGAVPQMIIIKSRDNSRNWTVYHEETGNTKFLTLNATNAAETASNRFNDTSPNSTVFTIGTSDNVNASENYIAWCFAEVDGYSKIGSYTGNGSTDGAFVYTGFRPAWVMIKKTSATDNWVIIDSTRDVDNVASQALYADGNFAEDSNVTNRSVDFLSNGFKLRSSGTYINLSGGTFIYMAFAEAPFKYANAR